MAPLDLLDSLISFLSGISSIAIIAGAIFVVFQLRQNAKLIEATIHENRSNIALAFLERLTDERFATRRKKMIDVIKKYRDVNWEGFDDSIDDFEVRNFAYIYELIGQFAKDKIVDIATVRNALQYLVVFDWDAFAPVTKHLMERFKLLVNPWENFEWLANETKKYMAFREEQARAGTRIR